MIAQALVHLRVLGVEGFDGLKRKIFQIRKTRKINKASSVYRRQSKLLQKEVIEVVIEVVFDPEGSGLTDLHADLEQVQGVLLTIKDELRVDPDLPIPHPSLILDAFVLKMSAECAPYWEHRVKQETLQALSQKIPSDDTAEFLTQGAALINLSV